ncbi:hypothetical protein [Actinoplanes sp. ATCC 53533]|uniref:hypothetical protein n=1 Tax=Actinoplanes sp. ATCC 53533 TaxID=1288362 RepID=UPI000F780BA8|nr:hypothetical protein [Actinoplanes sp. ATCC 53533]
MTSFLERLLRPLAERRVVRVSPVRAEDLIREARSRPDGRRGNLGWFTDNRTKIDEIFVVPTSIYRLSSGRVLCALIAVMNKRTFTTYVDVGSVKLLTLPRARSKRIAKIIELCAAHGEVLKDDQSE